VYQRPGRRQPVARQRTILELSATGLSSAEVASALQLTVHEVSTDLARAILTLGARSKLEAVIIALRRGLIRLPCD
jgi:DNA-binding CsgD family transcriptional regulator